ncbi:MAG: hypothetical protein U1E14_19030 [Geminicoccaceae bacterium]
MFARTLFATLWPVGPADRRRPATATPRRPVASQVTPVRETGTAPIALIAESFLVAAGGSGRR